MARRFTKEELQKIAEAPTARDAIMALPDRNAVSVGRKWEELERKRLADISKEPKPSKQRTYNGHTTVAIEKALAGQTLHIEWWEARKTEGMSDTDILRMLENRLDQKVKAPYHKMRSKVDKRNVEYGIPYGSEPNSPGWHRPGENEAF